MSESEAVREILDAVPNADRRRDAVALVEIMREVTGEEPRVWSAGTIGFGRYHYRYKTGQEGDFFQIGLAPRKDKLTLYVMSGLRGFEDILERLGPHTSSKSTVHLKSLDGVDRAAPLAGLAARHRAGAPGARDPHGARPAQTCGGLSQGISV